MFYMLMMLNLVLVMSSDFVISLVASGIPVFDMVHFVQSKFFL